MCNFLAPPFATFYTFAMKVIVFSFSLWQVFYRFRNYFWSLFKSSDFVESRSESHSYPNETWVSSYFQVVYWKCGPGPFRRIFFSPTQALFMYALVIDRKLNLGYIAFKSIRATHTGLIAPITLRLSNSLCPWGWYSLLYRITVRLPSTIFLLPDLVLSLRPLPNKDEAIWP